MAISRSNEAGRSTRNQRGARTLSSPSFIIVVNCSVSSCSPAHLSAVERLRPSRDENKAPISGGKNEPLLLSWKLDAHGFVTAKRWPVVREGCVLLQFDFRGGDSHVHAWKRNHD